jgi:hypothetical protein
LVNRNIYISISLIGFVFALLTLLTEQPEVAITIFYFTWVILLLIKLVEEWRYYNSYNAPLASAIFILLPTLIAIGGSVLADIASIGDEGLLQTSLANIDLNLDILNIGSFYLYFNIFGLIFALPFFIILLVLLRWYYSGRYPSIFVFRKRLSSDTLILYNCLMLLILGYFWIDRRIVELSGLSFIIVSYIFFIQYYLLKLVLVPLRRVSSMRRFYSPRTTTSNNNSRPTTSLISWNSPSSSISRPRNAARPSTRISAPNQGSISVAPALNASTTRAVKKLSPAVIASLTPVGQHLTDDDFRCIFCYEFPTEANRRVVICPYCKHPAHANEFQKWLAVANICSRCNKPIANAKMIRLSGKNYKKIIRMFQKK